MADDRAAADGAEEAAGPKVAHDLARYEAWTEEDVVAWLRRQRIVSEDVLERVAAHQVDGELLVELDNKAWVELGVESSLERAKLRRAIKVLIHEWKHSLPEGTLHTVPLFNLVYDLLFDGDPPTAAALGGALEALALVAALFLTIVTQFGASFEFDEVALARARFNAAPYSDYKSGDQVVQDLTQYLGLSTFTLAGSLCSPVVILLALSVTQEGASPDVDVRAAWWSLSRWVVALALVLLFVGIATSFLVFNRTIFLKFPDVVLERTGEFAPFQWGSLIGFYTNFVHVSVLGSSVLALAVMSLAKRRAHRRQKGEWRHRVEREKAMPKRALSTLFV